MTRGELAALIEGMKGSDQLELASVVPINRMSRRNSKNVIRRSNYCLFLLLKACCGK